MKTPTPPRRLRRNDSGASLILVLSLIVLVTFATMAFFTRSADNTAVENARAAKIVSEQLSASGADHALAGFLTEIASGSVLATNAAGSVMYLPASPGAMVPARGLAQGSMQTDANFAALIRQSVQGGDASASTHGTGTPSKNGRSVSATRWNAPRLLPSGFYSSYQLPNWIYVNTDGSLSSVPGSNTIGRFAYNAYDIGGLLDANAVGRPSGMTPAQLSAVVGTAAGADLSIFSGVSQSDVDALVAFRNPQAASPSAYTNYVAGAASAGFLGSVITNASGGGVSANNFFATRQDLIRYATMRNTAMTNILAYLTHFSRELARPSIVTNGLSLMTRRFDLSSVVATNKLPAGLAGGFPSYAATSSVTSILQNSNPDLFQVLRAAVNFGTTSWETNAPTNAFLASSANWSTNLSHKAVQLGANLIDQFNGAAQPVRITYTNSPGPWVVTGKKQIPYVMQVFLVFNKWVKVGGEGEYEDNEDDHDEDDHDDDDHDDDDDHKPKPSSNSITLYASVIPQVSVAGSSVTPTTLTASLQSGRLSLTGVTNVALPTNIVTVTNPSPSGASPVYATPGAVNPVKRGFFATNIVITKSISNSLTLSLTNLSIVLKAGTNTNSSGNTDSTYDAFGTNGFWPSTGTNAPLAAATFSGTFVLTNLITTNITSPKTNQLAGVSVLAAGPMTLRGAGFTNTLPVCDPSALSIPLVPVSAPAYPGSVTDTNTPPLQARINNVGELGYVFRDSPWRSIDFVSGSGSADRNLLDVCSAYATPASGIRAGVVNLNTRQAPVLASLLCGASTTGSGTISPASAIAFASNMVSVTGSAPLTNRAQLVDLVASNVLTSASETTKRGREAAIRALAEPGQTRTWNVLIDVIAQDGNFTGASRTAGDFSVLGERRVWVSVAIDRVTGQIIDRMSEDVNE